MSGPSIQYREHRPAAALKPYLECLWLAWDSRRRPARVPEHIVPDACPEIIVHLGDRFSRRVGARWRRQPRAFLAGTLSQPWVLRAGPRVRTLGMRFRPGAITALFPLDMKRATDREIELATLVGATEARDLVRRLVASRDAGAGFATAERWLMERHARARPARSDLTRRAVARILASRGQRRIEEVAGALGVPRRRLERAFARDLGIRPKLFARIVRLNAALATLGRAERARAVDVALEAGYFDQAHLARDFRAVAGRRAGADPAGSGEMARNFTRSARLLAFLAGE